MSGAIAASYPAEPREVLARSILSEDYEVNWNPYLR